MYGVRKKEKVGYQMAYDLEIRFKCRTHFEIFEKSLKDISKLENVPISTLSEWKNDDRIDYGGIWIKGIHRDKVKEIDNQLKDELHSTSTYAHLKQSLLSKGNTEHQDISMDSLLQIKATPDDIRATVEADALMLNAVGLDWYNASLLKNAMLSITVLNNQVKKDITKVRQADIKMSSETIKISKEAQHGKSPDTMILNVNGEYTREELKELSLEDIEKLYHKEQQELLADKPKVTKELNTQVNT